MKSTLPIGLLAASLLLSAPRSAAAAEEGEKIFQEACSSCHNAKQQPLDGKHLTREKWKDAIEKMEGNGAEVPTGKKLETLLDWLVRTNGPDVGKPAGK